jgi:hypothetical protein
MLVAVFLSVSLLAVRADPLPESSDVILRYNSNLTFILKYFTKQNLTLAILSSI